MDKDYVIRRVRSDLRNEIYELMTHVGYHALEKELTEAVLNTHPLYSAIRTYSLDPAFSMEEKKEHKELFAYLIYRTMNESLGGFHFDRYRSLSTGSLEVERMNQVVQTFDFNAFLREYDNYEYLKQDPEWEPFVESHQYRHLEDAITASIKKNRVIPGVARAIGKDIVDALNLTEDYGYVRVSPTLLVKEFDPPNAESTFVSLCRTPIEVDGQRHIVLLTRASRTADTFRLLATNFGALIKGT